MDRLDIRPAAEGDYPAVRDFYYALTDEMADAPYRPGWEKDVYPAQEFLKDSIRRGELYLGFLDGALAACMVVNHATTRATAPWPGGWRRRTTSCW